MNFELDLTFSDSCVTKSPSLSLGGWEIIDFFQSRSENLGDHHLSNSFPMTDGKRLLPKIDQDDTDFPTIVGIDRPWSVDNPNPLLNGQPTARSDLAFKPLRDCYSDPGRNEFSLSRFQSDFFLQGGEEIHPRGTLRHILRHGHGMIFSQAFDINFHPCPPPEQDRFVIS